MTYQDNSEEDSYENETHFDLIPQVESLHQRCVSILKECKAWNEKKHIEGLHRYTNSLSAEMHFIEKVWMEEASYFISVNKTFSIYACLSC